MALNPSFASVQYLVGLPVSCWQGVSGKCRLKGFVPCDRLVEVASRLRSFGPHPFEACRQLEEMTCWSSVHPVAIQST